MGQERQYPRTATSASPSASPPASGLVGDADDLVRRVRDESPHARELDKITAAHAAHGGLAHRLWLDEQASALWLLRRTASADAAADELRLHRIPLRDPSSTRVLADLTAATLARLASPADSYRARPELDRDIGALVQLFRIRLAHLRSGCSDPAALVRAIHAHIKQAGDEEQARRRRAFLAWSLVRLYHNQPDAHEQAERDLAYDAEEDAGTDADPLLIIKAVMDWLWYRDGTRGKVPQPVLERIPDDGRLRPKDRYWYYEFRTVGRHLTEQQMRELRARLPLADITSRSLVLDQWSDPSEHPIFGAAHDIMCQFFDAGLSFSHKESRTLWLRLPATLADRTAPYEDGVGVRTTIVDDDLVLRLHGAESEETDDEDTHPYFDPRPWLAELLPLRDDLAAGDIRAAAIGRRAALQAANETLADGEEPETFPMPDGLDEDELTPQLHALRRLLEELP